MSEERPRDLAGAAYEGEAARRAADRVAAYLGYGAEDLDAFKQKPTSEPPGRRKDLEGQRVLFED